MNKSTCYVKNCTKVTYILCVNCHGAVCKEHAVHLTGQWFCPVCSLKLYPDPENAQMHASFPTTRLYYHYRGVVLWQDPSVSGGSWGRWCTSTLGAKSWKDLKAQIDEALAKNDKHVEVRRD